MRIQSSVHPPVRTSARATGRCTACVKRSWCVSEAEDFDAAITQRTKNATGSGRSAGAQRPLGKAALNGDMNRALRAASWSA
ncbi:hypothetical protein M8494_25955 [Serratia ureilytica]